MNYYAYQGKVLPDFFTTYDRAFVEAVFAPSSCNQRDFGLPPIEAPGDLLKSFEEYLDRQGWTLISDLCRFKARGTIVLHRDLDAQGDRYEHEDSHDVYNACLVLKIIHCIADLDRTFGSEYQAGHLHFISERVPHDGSHGLEEDAEDVLYTARKLAEGQVVIFDQNHYHGIMTDNGYWLLLCLVRKKQG